MTAIDKPTRVVLAELAVAGSAGWTVIAGILVVVLDIALSDVERERLVALAQRESVDKHERSQAT